METFVFRLNSFFQACGCECPACTDTHSIHLHQEIEDLKRSVTERDNQIMTMESQILSHAKQYPNGEMEALKENIYFWQEKYDRLLENLRKLQKVNQGLEDKLLRVADKFENERVELTNKVSDMTDALSKVQLNCAQLEQQNRDLMDVCSAMPPPSNDISLIAPIPAPKPSERESFVTIPTFPPSAFLCSLNATSRSSYGSAKPLVRSSQNNQHQQYTSTTIEMDNGTMII